jgi:hypothetical protein
VAPGLESRLPDLLADTYSNPVERARLAQLMCLFAELPPPPDPGGFLPRYAELKEMFLGSLIHGDSELIEERFLVLYSHLHMHEAPYTAEERRRVDETGGYWSHAGGLSPILKAGDWLRPESVSADFGAGNGLQGLLMQKLYPHARTIQVEISHRMVEIGKLLRRWLGIPGHRIVWQVDDVMDASTEGVDFLYMYRPVRPDGPGRAFYERIAEELGATDREVVVFSIADCLCDFLPDSFEIFYNDGHLSCFRKTRRDDSRDT